MITAFTAFFSNNLFYVSMDTLVPKVPLVSLVHKVLLVNLVPKALLVSLVHL